MAIERIPPLVTLRTVRELLGWSSTKAAERMAEFGTDYHADSILNVERGLRGARGEPLTALALAYGIDPADVWTEDRTIAAAKAILQKNPRAVA